MIDIHDLRARPEVYLKACKDKRITIDITAFLELDAKLVKAKQDFEQSRALQNAVSRDLPKLSGAEKEAKLAEMKELAPRIKELSENVRILEEEWQKIMLLLPGIPLAKVPLGKDDSENVEVKRWGEIKKPTFKIKDHATLGRELDIIDIERGVKIAGSRSYFLKGDGARLQHAILSLAMDMLETRGFTMLEPPHLVKYEAMMGTSYFPGGEESAYKLDERDKDTCLIGTSEVSVTSYYQDETLALDALPIRYAGISPCYRREAGTYGKDTNGLYRVHQFYKVEQVIVCENTPEASAKHHAEILKNAEDVLQLLNLPYRVVDVCTGDMGRGQVYKNDIEAWMPSRNAYGETHSCSTFYEFQARRLNLKYKKADGKNAFCHTLNNTCVASPRILIPILENYQNEDGSVTIPEPLRKYMGGRDRITKKK